VAQRVFRARPPHRRGSWGFSAINSPLFRKAELLDEILKYAYIPKEVVKAYREHALEEAKGAKSR